MGFVTLPQKFLSQPQYAAPIDRQGLGKGMQFLFNPAVGPVDLATGRIWTYGGTAAKVATPYGQGLNLDGAGYLAYTGYPELNSNVGTFFAWFTRVGAPDAFGHVLLSETGGVSHQVHSSGTIYIGSSGSTGVISNWFNTTNRSIVLLSDGTAAGTKCYVDGVDSGLTWGGAPSTWPSGSKTLDLGTYSPGSAWDTDGTILSVGNTSSVWSANQVARFHQSKGNELYQTPTRKIWFGGTSFNSYTITPSGGVVFGGTNNLVKGKVIVPSGGIVFSGNNPIIGTRTYTINPVGGIVFGGTGSMTSSNAQTYIITPTGGIAFSGSASLIKTNIILPSGGIAFSGSAPMTSNTVISTVTTRLPLTGAGG